MTARTDSWRSFRLVPDDVLFFRDGKPSTQGFDHYLRSIFPPHPFTLYGALRTRRLLDEGVPLRGLAKRWPKLPAELREELGEWCKFGALEVRGPWLVRDDEVVLPAPGDLLVKPKEREKERPSRREPTVPPQAETVARLRLPHGNGGAGGASHDLPGLEPHLRNGAGWQAVELSEERNFQRTASYTVDWWITPEGLATWRRGEVPQPGQLVHRDELWVDEQRTGVGLEAGDRKAEESMIYTFGFIRLQPEVALGFEARNTGLRPGRRVRLGGEARTAMLEEGPAFPGASAQERPAPGEPVRLALATPALSEGGAWPPGFSAASQEADLGGHRVRLLGASVGGFTLVGGWDLARRGPKALRRAIPAGAVFLVQPSGGARGTEDGLGALDGSCWSDYDDEHLARQGFGLTLVGRS